MTSTMTRYEHCGAAVALPTEPAWSFGTKHHPGDPPPGPGTGKYPGAADTWLAGTSQFGKLPGAVERPSQTSSLPYSGERYLRPDYLSQNPKGPAWGFGQRTGKAEICSPGVGSYSPRTDTFLFPRQPHAVWGPPPRRPPSAPSRPRPLAPLSERHPARPKPASALPGATFKGKYPPAPLTDSPGPAYLPCCGGHCCDMCEKYNGVSFGIRHHVHEEPPVPPPDYYHMGCSTLGAAAAGCLAGKAGGGGHSHSHGHRQGGSGGGGESGHTHHLRRPSRQDYAYYAALQGLRSLG